MEGFYFILIEVVKGALALMLAMLILTIAGYFTYKTMRIFISLFNYEITEPEPKIVKKAHKAVKTK